MTASSLGDSVRVRQVFWFTSPAYNVEKTYEQNHTKMTKVAFTNTSYSNSAPNHF